MQVVLGVGGGEWSDMVRRGGVSSMVHVQVVDGGPDLVINDYV